MANGSLQPHQSAGALAGVYPSKPRMRGWSHAVAAIAALGVTIGLMIQTHDDMVRFVSVLIFGLSMILLYGFSAIYHIGPWQGRRHAVLRAIDHANIFLLIAGTYTPISVIVLSGKLRIAVLSIIWTLALAGALGTVLMLKLPRWLSTALYIGMGWMSVITIPTLLARLPWQALLLLLAGGILYTIGGVVYALRKPNPLPRVFGFHEVFHLFTIAAGAAFIIAIWGWVVPFTYA